MTPNAERKFQMTDSPAKLPVLHPSKFLPEHLEDARQDFLRRYPSYPQTKALDDLRSRDYARLDKTGQIYLDYTGGGVYGESQLQAHFELLRQNVYGNPHSTNPTSLAMTRLVESARAYVLEFFKADPREYVCIFTQNASGSLKLVGESYPFGPGGRYMLTFDNHNSVNGIREYARARGAQVTYLPIVPPDLRLDEKRLESELAQRDPACGNLFAYPAQSNFSGVQHSLEWIERAHVMGWDVLLDSAAFAPSNQLDLSVVHPDFATFSFYKIFGYPTGVGALIARREALAKLHRPWFAGGTITVASVQGDRYYLHEGAEGFEDGTLNYLTLPAVEIGLRHIRGIGYEAIHTRVACLTGWMLDELSELRHCNGRPVVKIFGPLTGEQRGGTVALDFYDANGDFIDHARVEELANQVNISLRTGCFCNPGGGEVALGLTAGELKACFNIHQRLEYNDFRRCIDDKNSGAVRISVGLVSTFEDVYQLLTFAEGFKDKCRGEV